MADKQLPSSMGGTFAERAAAAQGKKTFKDPREDAPEVVENTTFGSRGSKAVASETAEDKSVKRSSSKKA